MSTLSELISAGVNDKLESFESVKTRLTNILSLIGGVLSIIFGTLNLSVGATSQGAMILSGVLLITIPTIYLNHKEKRELARAYMLIISSVFIVFITFRAVFNFENRHNELFLIGFSSIILVLLNNPFRTILYSSIAICTLVMITVRQTHAGLEINSDTYMAYLNCTIAYLFIYIFLNFFRREQEKSLFKLESYSTELEKQGEEITKQRDDVFANRKLIRDTIDNLPVFIGLIDMNGTYLLANKLFSKTFGLPLDKIEGHHYTEVLPMEIQEKHSTIIRQGLNGGSPEFNEITYIPGGKNMHTMGKYLPLYDQNEKQFALAVYVVDVTQLKNTEEELITLNDTKNRLLSIISHDIRGPLNSLKGLISLSDQISKKEFKNFIQNVDKQLSTVNFNLDNVLNWAKTQMDGFRISPHQANVNEILTNCTKLFEPSLKEKGILIKIEIDDNISAFVDNNCLYLIFRNLISNAIKFSNPKSEISIASYKNEHEVSIQITDRGSGIPPEKIEELEAGAQAVNSDIGTLGESGTGLGLSLSYEMAKLNKGKLILRPNPAGGTVATVILPKTAPPKH